MSLKDIFRGFRNHMPGGASDIDNQAAFGEAEELTCRTAMELIDSTEPLSAGERSRLEAHIAVCSNCAAAAGLEDVLRETIAPAVLPSPSAGFEAALMLELDLIPEAEAKPDPLARLSLIAALVPLTLLVIAYFRPISKAFFKGTLWLMDNLLHLFINLDGVVNSTVAGVIGQANGFLYSHFGELIATTGLSGTLILSMMCVSFMVISGAVAIGYANQRWDLSLKV